MYCLWLNGKKINSAAEIRLNYDSVALCGYFLGGSLVKWLYEAEAPELAERVSKIDIGGDIDTQLAVIFGKTAPEPYIRKPFSQQKTQPPQSGLTANGSFGLDTGSFSISSGIQAESFFFGSYYTGSFFSGSFFLSSFSSESVGGSFKPGSYALSSFHYKQGNMQRESAPQEKIRINLSSCPLNRFGYGIHLI